MNLKDFDLNLLVVFDAIYASRSVSKAAERLNLAQPTVSHSLSRLRKQFDDPLFIRSGNGVTPTSKASAIANPIRAAIENLQKGLNDDEEFDPAFSHRQFKVMTADPMEPVIVPPIIQQIQNHGGVTLELINPSVAPLEQALVDGLADVAVFLQPAHEEGLLWEPLCPLDLVFIARRGHPARAEAEDPNFISRYGHVSLNLKPGVLKNSSKIQLWQRLQRRDVCVVSRLNSIPNIVANSDLLAVVPLLFARKMAHHFSLDIIQPPSKLSEQRMYMIWHQRNETDKGHQWLRGQIQNAVSDTVKGKDLECA